MISSVKVTVHSQKDQAMDDLPQHKKAAIDKLALAIFTRYSPQDPAMRRHSCPQCNASVKDFDTRCGNCGTAFAACVFSGRPIIDTSEADNDWYHEVDMRGRIEQRLTDKLALPRVEIVVQGGVGTLLTVLHALKRSVPIVLVRESKGCAKALADFVTKLRTSPITGTAGSAEDLAFWRRQLVDELNCNNCGLDSQWVKLEKDINRLVELLLCERPGSDGIKPPPHATGDDAHETASNTLVQIFTVTDECSPRTRLRIP